MKTKLKPDGRYGRGTSQAVRAFQKKHDLIVTGIAGAVTQAKITELLAQ
jgi:peptidoglycan hydrolase-like protein with peptidoglycan-binding domain